MKAVEFTDYLVKSVVKEPDMVAVKQFTLEDGTDVNAFKQNLKSSANMRWNICTQADEMICISQGNKVLFVMCKNGEE